MCVIFFLCSVWKEPCKRTKKKYAISPKTKQNKKKGRKKSYFRNENARDWAREKNRKRLK